MNQVYAILTLYNPNKNELDKVVENLKKQVAFVVICNNSDFDVILDDKRVKVLNFGENLGIATAQNRGMSWAFNNGADFILQMDQDSIPARDMVEKLLECYFFLESRNYKVGLVGCQDFDKDTKEISQARVDKGKNIANTDYLWVNQMISSGTLMPKKTYDIAGALEDKLFIDIVDFEYCWRLKNHNLLNIKNPHAKLAHKLGYGKKIFLGLIKIIVPAPVRHYYQYRNFFLLILRSYVPIYWKVSNSIKLCFSLLFIPFLLNKGFTRLNFMLKGIKDGILKKGGGFDQKH